MTKFEEANKQMIYKMGKDDKLQELSQAWYLAADQVEYSYHFSWMGLPIIQYPQDIIAMQELIFKIKPDLIIETGIARGGSLVFYASMLSLLGGNRKVLGLDIDIRHPNRIAIENHSMYGKIQMLEGSSTAPDIIQKVHNIAQSYNNILLVLDSNHTHDHVLMELQAYSPLVNPPSYIVIFDTKIEFTPSSRFSNRPWQPGNSPMTAVQKFLENNNRFKIDEEIEHKLLITECPSGYLLCIAK